MSKRDQVPLHLTQVPSTFFLLVGRCAQMERARTHTHTLTHSHTHTDSSNGIGVEGASSLSTSLALLTRLETIDIRS